MHNRPDHVFSLPHLAAWRLKGEDAAAFSQANLTRDTTALDPSAWYPAAWCDARGRALAVLLIRLQPDRADWVLPADEARRLMPRLRMFMLRRRLRLTLCEHLDGSFIEPDGASRRRLAFDAGRALEVSDSPTNTDPGSVMAWQQADLRAGMPWLHTAGSARYLPQMLGLEAMQAISYRKGCYPGQEVIARVHYLGAVKRRLTGFRTAGGEPPSPGSPLRDEQDKACGEVLWSLADGEHAVGLAVVQHALPDGASLRLEQGTAVLLPPERL